LSPIRVIGFWVLQPARRYIAGWLRTLRSTGYRGRAGIFELLELTDEVRPLVGAQADASLIDGAAIRSGMTTMLDDAVEKCRIGMTRRPKCCA